MSTDSSGAKTRSFDSPSKGYDTPALSRRVHHPGGDGPGGKMSVILAMALVLSGLPAGSRQEAEGSAPLSLVPVEVGTVVSGGYW